MCTVSLENLMLQSITLLFHICLFLFYKIFIYISLSKCNNLSTKHKFILFFAFDKLALPRCVVKAEALLKAFCLSVGTCRLANVLTTLDRVHLLSILILFQKSHNHLNKLPLSFSKVFHDLEH